MCTVLLPPGGNPIAVNKYIISYFILERRAYPQPKQCSFSRVFTGEKIVNLLSCANKATVLLPMSYCRASTVNANMLLNLPWSATENFQTCPDRPWGIHSLLYNEYRVCPWVKRPGRGVKHPPASRAEIKVRIWHSEDRSPWYIPIIVANKMHYFATLFW